MTRPSHALRPISRLALGATALALLVLGSALEVQAQNKPCTSLSPERTEEYTAIAMSAIEAYNREDYATSIELNLEALKICYEDANLYYNLARSYHKAGDCHMALFTYEEISIDDLDKDKRKTLAAHTSELQAACGASGIVLITCDDSDVELEFSGRTTRCPFTGRVDFGDHEIVATRPGYRPWFGTLRVVEGSDNTFDVPALVSEDAYGQLAVSCGEGVQSFTLITADNSVETLQCPWQGELPVGTYTLSTDPRGAPVTATVLGRATTNIDALATPPPSSCACQLRRAEPSHRTSNAPLHIAASLAALLALVGLRRRARRR